MLRVLTLSTLFPDLARPNFGTFVERQTLGLAALADVEMEVLAGIGLPPWPLSLHPHYAARRRVPPVELWKALPLHRPRFRVLPWQASGSARSLADAALPLLKIIRERFPFEVIDAEFFWPDGVAAMHLSRALDVPFSVKARGSDIHFWGGVPPVAAQMREAARAAGGILAVSDALKHDMAALGMPDERIAVHYTGVDLDLFAPADRTAAKARLGVEGPLLVCVGALIPLKGQSIAIEAVREIEGANLLLVGDGPERASLVQTAERCGVANRVRVLGSRPHEDVAALLAAADVMVLPSAREGLANVWVEALACGTPLVITDVGGAREVVDSPDAGRIADREAGAVARAIKDLLASPADPAAARSSAKRFSWAKNASELRRHLGRISGERHQRGNDPALLTAQ